jgi:chromosome segregation ATPase
VQSALTEVQGDRMQTTQDYAELMARNEQLAAQLESTKEQLSQLQESVQRGQNGGRRREKVLEAAYVATFNRCKELLQKLEEAKVGQPAPEGTCRAHEASVRRVIARALTLAAAMGAGAAAACLGGYPLSRSRR